MSPPSQPNRLTDPLRRAVYVALTALTLIIYSEHLFWARPGPWATVQGFLPTFLAYFAATYLFLVTIACFRVRSGAALFLAAAIYGWLLEGVIVQTMYDDFPLNLSFTGLAWHALLSVMLGWVILPACLSRGPLRRSIVLAAAIGACYGLWSLWWWTIEPPPAAPRDFTAYTLVLTLALMLSYGLAPRLGLRAFQPSRLEIGMLVALAVTWSIAVTVPAQPLSLIVLPPLAALLLAALTRNRRREARPDQIQAVLAEPPPGAAQLLTLLALPAASSVVYILATALAIRPPTGVLLYAITVPAGFALLAWALLTTLRRPSRAPASDAAVSVVPPAPVP